MKASELAFRAAEVVLSERGHCKGYVSGEDIISLLKETGHRLEEAGR